MSEPHGTGTVDEAQLVDRARQGDPDAVAKLIEPWRRPLFGYIYRMVSRRPDAEDLLQDVLMRVLQSVAQFRGESPFKSWLFGIATHVCLDHLRKKGRWRLEAQFEAERRANATPEARERVHASLSQPGSAFEIREHIAACFSCVSRTLEPEEQAALMLREVLGFSAFEAARVLAVSEPVFRHRLSAARRTMVDAYEGLCQLVNKTGACWQCRSLREFAPEQNRGANLERIEVGPGLTVTPDSLFNARLGIVRDADLAEGRTRPFHDLFFEDIARHEDAGE